MRHTVKPVITHLGAGLRTTVYAIFDNLDRLVAWEQEFEDAKRRAAVLSEPPQDE